MKLEEAIEIVNKYLNFNKIVGTRNFKEALETVLKEIKFLKRENTFLTKGFRAMSITLDYQRAIVAILETLKISEIEIDDVLLKATNFEIRVEHTLDNTTKISLLKKE